MLASALAHRLERVGYRRFRFQQHDYDLDEGMPCCPRRADAAVSVDGRAVRVAPCMVRCGKQSVGVLARGGANVRQWRALVLRDGDNDPVWLRGAEDDMEVLAVNETAETLTDEVLDLSHAGLAGGGAVRRDALTLCDSTAGVPCELDIAVSTDGEYAALAAPDTVLDDVEFVVQAANVQYERELGVRHVIAVYELHTDAATDPFPEAASSCALTLGELAAAYGAHPGRGTVWHLWHHLSGKPRAADAGTTIGCSYVGAACSSAPWGYSLARASAVLAFRASLVAHELGHGWGAAHYADAAYTMNAAITGATQFHPQSLAEMRAHMDGAMLPAGCLRTGGGDVCGDGVCGADESCATCAADCPPRVTTVTVPSEPECGDGVCNGARETCENCPRDCERRADGVCCTGNALLALLSGGRYGRCYAEGATGPQQVAVESCCGDGVCNWHTETCAECPQDCTGHPAARLCCPESARAVLRVARFLCRNIAF